MHYGGRKTLAVPAEQKISWQVQRSGRPLGQGGEADIYAIRLSSSPDEPYILKRFRKDDSSGWEQELLISFHLAASGPPDRRIRVPLLKVPHHHDLAVCVAQLEGRERIVAGLKNPRGTQTECAACRLTWSAQTAAFCNSCAQAHANTRLKARIFRCTQTGATKLVDIAQRERLLIYSQYDLPLQSCIGSSPTAQQLHSSIFYSALTPTLQDMYRRSLRLARRLIQGLTYLHEHKVLHGDVKPCNMLCNLVNGDMTAVVYSDFGHSILLTQARGHIPPEIRWGFGRCSAAAHHVDCFIQYQRGPVEEPWVNKVDVGSCDTSQDPRDGVYVQDLSKLSEPFFGTVVQASSCGTPAYAAPETRRSADFCLDAHPNHQGRQKALSKLYEYVLYADYSEVYSLGVSLLEIFSGTAAPAAPAVGEEVETKFRRDQAQYERYVRTLYDPLVASQRTVVEQCGRIAAVPDALLQALKRAIAHDIMARPSLPQLFAIITQCDETS